jgi:hypothetical protein
LQIALENIDEGGDEVHKNRRTNPNLKKGGKKDGKKKDGRKNEASDGNFEEPVWHCSGPAERHTGDAEYPAL